MKGYTYTHVIDHQSKANNPIILRMSDFYVVNCPLNQVSILGNEQPTLCM